MSCHDVCPPLGPGFDLDGGSNNGVHGFLIGFRAVSYRLIVRKLFLGGLDV